MKYVIMTYLLVGTLVAIALYGLGMSWHSFFCNESIPIIIKVAGTIVIVLFISYAIIESVDVDY